MDCIEFKDRLNAYLRGELGESDMAEIEAHSRSCPACCAFANDYRLAYRADPTGELTERSEVTVWQIHSRLRSRPANPLRRAARVLGPVAAAAAVAFAVGLYVGRGVATPVVKTTDTRPSDRREPEQPFLARFADYRPVRGRTIAWLDDLDAAQRLSRLTGRPWLLYIYYPACPICAGMERTTLSDPQVLTLLDEFVCVRLNIATVAQGPVMNVQLKEGWPFWGIYAADGSPLALSPGRKDAAEFAAMLREALGAIPPDRRLAFMSWQALGERAALAAEVAGAIDAGRFSLAWRLCERLASPHDGPSLAREADVYRQRIEAIGRDELARAQTYERVYGSRAAISLLAYIQQEFAGTPVAERAAHEVGRVENASRSG